VGVLSLNDFDILDARSYRQDSNTLGAFKVRSLPSPLSEENRLKRAEKQLDAVVKTGFNLGFAFRKKMTDRGRLSSLQKPFDVDIDNDSSFLFTLIEVRADDFPGVLFTITDAIVKCGLDIWNTRISTVSGRIQDTFYVKEFNGRKIKSPDQISTLRAKLRNAYHLLKQY
jgi:[protein-PII] uridylyltransferase